MFTPELFRAKAAECKELAKTANDADEAREFQRRERSFIVLADNEQWRADHHDQTVLPMEAAGGIEPVPGLKDAASLSAPQ